MSDKKVTDLFVEDEITGLMVPNVKPEPVWILLDKNGQGVRIVKSLNEAINEMSKDPEIHGYVKM
jgi:hypothetical protein